MQTYNFDSKEVISARKKLLPLFKVGIIKRQETANNIYGYTSYIVYDKCTPTFICLLQLFYWIKQELPNLFIIMTETPELIPLLGI